MESLGMLADQNGIGMIFRKIVAAANSHGMVSRTYTGSVMFAPPQNRFAPFPILHQLLDLGGELAHIDLMTNWAFFNLRLMLGHFQFHRRNGRQFILIHYILLDIKDFRYSINQCEISPFKFHMPIVYEISRIFSPLILPHNKMER